MAVRPSPLAASLFDTLPLGRDPVSVRRRVEAVERLLEGMFVVPVINRRVGLDAIVGLVPVVGDLLAGAMGAWLVWEARNIGLGRLALAGMGTRVAFDTLLGMVPVVGDAADFFYRSNTRNLKRIKRHLDRHHPASVTIQR